MKLKRKGYKFWITLIVQIFFTSNFLISQCWNDAVITSQKNYSLNNIQFINDKIGYCQESLGGYTIGESTDFLYKTIDGGKNWKTHVKAPRDIYDGFYVINEKTFFLYGQYNLIRTEDGGNNWTASIQNNNYRFYKMFFLNTNIGWATSYPGNIWKSIDGGKKWNIIYNYNLLNGPSPSVGDQIVFLNENIGFLLTNKIFKTVDGGLTWQDMGIWFPTDFQLIANKLIILTEKSKIVIDINGNIVSNINHYFHPFNLTGELRGFYRANFSFINDKIGWYTSTEGVHYTKDGGLNWSNIYDQKTNDLYFDQKGTGVLIGYDIKNHYYYTCNFEQHDNDFYDRCYFSYIIENPSLNKTYNVSNLISREYYQYGEIHKTPVPSCWSSNDPNIRRPYFFSFAGNNKQITIEVNKNSLVGGKYLKASLYTGDCKSLSVINCGQIDDFNNKISFQINTEINKHYYLLFDGKGLETVSFNVIFNSGSITSTANEIEEINKIYPNPSSDFLHLEKLNLRINQFYQILDLNGKIIFSGDLIENSINISYLSPGIYLLKTISKDKKISFTKFIKI